MNAIRLYQEFEDWVKPVKSDKKKYLQYGFPGSGSTYVWQVVNYLVNGARKTHLCPGSESDYRIVATVRDFRDVLCTYFVRSGLPATKESTQFIFERFAKEPLKELYKVQDTWIDPERIIWLRYENFIDNDAYLFAELERFLQIKITNSQKVFCQEHFSLKANKSRCQNAIALSKGEGAVGWLDKNWTQYTIHGINGLHITSNGDVEKWKRFFSPKLQEYITETLQEPLKRFNYL